MSDMASYEQLSTLPIVAEYVVGPEHLDRNGHMNVTHYFVFGVSGMAKLHHGGMAMAEDYIQTQGMTTFTAEQHIGYAAESTLGDELGVATVAVDRGAKTLHLASFILNRTRAQLACVVESMLVHVDFATRRPVAFPDDVSARLDELIASPHLDARLPISGALGIRR